jgi:hypothetical protein
MLAAELTPADRERIAREQEASVEYGRTVADARKLAKRAGYFMIAVRTGTQEHDYIPVPSRRAFLAMLRNREASGCMPCEYRPNDLTLSVGTITAIRKAEGR